MKRQFLSYILVLAIWIIYSSCDSVKDPELVGIEDVKVEHVGLKESALNLKIHYFNPNKYKLKIRRAEGSVWLDGNPLGQFVLDTLIHIPANADFRLPLTLKMDMRYFIENMAKAFSGKLVAIKVEGMARAGKGFIYINYPIKYEGKEKLGDLMK